MITRPHGILAGDHDRAYRSLGRWFLVVGPAIVGCVLIRSSIQRSFDGDATTDPAFGFVLALLLLGVSLLVTVPRSSDPRPVVQDEGCVLLPVRCLPFVGGWVVVLLLSPFYVLMGAPGQPVNRYEAMWPLVVVTTPALCAWLAWRLLRADLRLRLDPAGIAVPSFWRDRVEHVRWDLIDQVLSRRRLLPELVLVHDSPADDLSFTSIDLRIPRWRAELLADVLHHYVEHPSARTDLVDAVAVDRLVSRLRSATVGVG